MPYSFPKEKIKVLLLENIHDDAVNAFKKEGYQVELLTKSLDEDELIERLEDVRILGIRSKTQLSPRVFEEAKQLKAVGAFCIGTNQIDLDAAADSGTIVFNAPYSNTRSVVELSIGALIMLARQVFPKSTKMHNGTWEKTADGAFEVRGKKLGIIGYGSIGAQLSVVAEAIGMDVYFYDIQEKLVLGNATKCETLEELLNISDFVSVHVDGRDENHMIFGEKEFNQMKDGAFFLNMSRGFVVDIEAMKKSLESGKVAGAAVDVFPEEPKKNRDSFENILCGIENLIMTPHIGGSTLEAQQNIATYVPSRIVDYINTGSTMGAVNFPNLQLPQIHDGHRFIHIHKNVPGMLAKINQLLADHDINIVGQHLKTDNRLGYVITDVSTGYDRSVLKDFANMPYTINSRVLY